ncbi:NUDIX domain-containing protein [Paenibacillus thermotolerans]|uniref:NUDIX domain-containing protein n=1 Tax=Paenibacillus thermotolerans TaxID=3027807 RepID=UPI0023687CEE|nr:MULTISPECIES: NUDIX hydrolase [unclassified Paenibacillus]
MIATNKDGYELLEFITLHEDELICYEWEVPAGVKEEGETSKECAMRELFEETAQIVHDMDFKGLLKVRKPNGAIKYNPVYFAVLDYIAPFIENDETDKILFWNLSDDIGYVDEVDRAVLIWSKSF